jgi:parvulin-like peptidyl-prolyl isomerase
VSSSSSTPDPGDGFGAFSETFTRMWSDFASKMAAAGMTPPSPDASSEMGGEMRDTFFQAWSDACDRYMRSEEFQKMMRESMSAAIELRKQLNEQLGEFQHVMQGASRQDVDSLVQGIEQLDRHVSETFEQLMERLDALGKRLDAVERQTATTSESTPSREKKTAKKTAKKTNKRQTGG